MDRQNIIYVVVLIFVLSILLIIILSPKSEEINNDRSILESKIIDYCEKDLHKLICDFDFYENAFKEIKTEVNWCKTELTPIVDNYVQPVSLILAFATYLPLGPIDNLSNFAKKGLTILVDVSKTSSNFAVKTDSINQLFKKIRNAHDDYMSEKTRYNLMLVNNSIKNEFVFEIYEIKKMLAQIENIFNEASGVLNSIDGIFKTVTDSFNKVRSFVPLLPRINNNELSLAEMNELRDVLESNRELMKSINEKLAKDILLVNNINSTYNILKLSFPGDY